MFIFKIFTNVTNTYMYDIYLNNFVVIIYSWYLVILLFMSLKQFLIFVFISLFNLSVIALFIEKILTWVIIDNLQSFLMSYFRGVFKLFVIKL